MKKVNFDEVVEKCNELVVRGTKKKNADVVAEELRDQIRAMGWDCLDEYDDGDEWFEENHPEVSKEDRDNYAVSDDNLQFLCNTEEWEGCTGRDVDWFEFSITFYGVWGEVGVFQVNQE